MDDRALASWLLIAGSVAVGWWYWHLSAADKLTRLGRTPMETLTLGSPSAGGLTTVPGGSPVPHATADDIRAAGGLPPHG